MAAHKPSNDKDYKELSHASRLQMRSVPMYPLSSTSGLKKKEKRRTKSADQYKHVKSRLPSKENLDHQPGGGTTRICLQKIPDYKAFVSPRIDSHTAVPYSTDPRPHTADGTTSRPSASRPGYSYKPRSRDLKIPLNDVKRFKDVKSRIDSRDPNPSVRGTTHSIEDLVETEGFLLNPRFNTVVKSHSFGTVEELFHCLNKELKT
ncbi:PREDICTED: uncharacterized protein LOC109583534 [Amphimedon queenslandica]|uniref:Uncharacterized protein n=2 Tax=Amphimedon queenslandica TaxID=400682 RepID=A0AAN0JCL6_AMPQE|nr:PREDICTED: uncharacterized protein LOC109583534 [Amphimedon queenslandica]|eukprot:XP_019854486.1 PREDICTED: uncharacterized protein LOC109583534 [Amphimedon queenslandica]